NALLPLLKYSPFIQAIQATGFIKKSGIQSFDRKINIYYDANPVTPVKFARKSEVETILDLYAKIYRDPQVEVLRTTFIESSGQKFTTDTSEFIRISKVLTPIGKTFIKRSDFTTQRLIKTLIDKKDPIIEQQEFTRKALISSSDETTIRKTLPTYNSVIPIVIPAGTVREDHENFVVHIFAEDINWGVRPEDWQNWSDAQKLKFVRSVRVKGGVGDALPTYNRFGFIVNDEVDPPTIRPIGYIYFLAKNLAKDADNVFYLNFNSSTVDDNSDEKQVFKDYLWVSITNFGVENDSLTWTENQSPSDVFNDILTDDDPTRLDINAVNSIPLPLSGAASLHQRDITDVETHGINLDEQDATKPTLTMWTTKGSDQIVMFDDLSWDRRTKTQDIKSVNKDDNTFELPDWEDNFDEGDVVWVGKKSSGGLEDGNIFDDTRTDDGVQLDAFEHYDAVVGKYTIVKVDSNNIKLNHWEDFTDFNIETVNDSPYIEDTFRIVGNKDLQTNIFPERDKRYSAGSNMRDGYRRYDRTINGAYLNGDLHNSEPLLPLAGIPTLRINLDSERNEEPFVGYVKLAKYTKSQNRILDEIKNEINPQSFYQVGALEDVSKFQRKTTINSSEVIPFSAFLIARWLFDSGNKNSDKIDDVNGYTFNNFDNEELTVGASAIAPNNGSSIILDERTNRRMTTETIPEITEAINNGEFSFTVWLEDRSGTGRFFITNNNGETLFWTQATVSVSGNTRKFRIASDFAPNFPAQSAPNPAFIAVTYDGDKITFYIGDQNGLNSNEQTHTLSISTNFYVRVDFNGFGIDDLRLFKIALTQEEVEQLSQG
ncbi:MAG: LamG-like jellyroll fold domain-containing protein, partial [Halothece sp.]